MRNFDLEKVTHPVRIHRWRDGVCACTEDVVAEEVFIRIFVNGRIYGTLDCSPWNPDELVIGYLYAEGLLLSREDILSVTVRDNDVHVQLHESWAEKAPRETQPAPLQLSSRAIPCLIRQLEERSELFRHTGGVHNAALSDGETILAICEDVGRRNALDRLIGHCLIHNIPMAGQAILFSGRVPEEIVRKAARMQCSAILSVSAPTSLGVQTAEEENILLAGFVRGNRFNVYTFPERISD